jgi:hypothetical protein
MGLIFGIFVNVWFRLFKIFFMDYRSIATERISCDPPTGQRRLVVRYGAEKRVAFQTPPGRVRVVKTMYTTQLHRIVTNHTVPQFEAFVETVMSRVQSSAELDPTTRVDMAMQHISLADSTDIYGPDGQKFNDDMVQGNEYLVACIVALTGVWVSVSDGGHVLSWGPVWEADQVKIYDTLFQRKSGRVFFDGKPFFRLDD